MKLLYYVKIFHACNSAETPTVLKTQLGVSILFIFKTFEIMKTLEWNQLEMLEGGRSWDCDGGSKAGNWLSVTGVVLLGVATVATGGGALAIVAGTWGTLATVSGGIVGAGNIIAGC